MNSNVTAATEPKDESSKKSLVNKGLLMKFAPPLISLVLLMIFFSLGTPYFLNVNNLLTVAFKRQSLGLLR